MEKWPTGIFTSIDEGLGADLDAVRRLGASTVHLHAPGPALRTPESTEKIKSQFAAAGVEIHGGLCGVSRRRLYHRRTR